MTAFDVDLSELDAVVTGLDTFAGSLAGRLDDLEAAITALRVDWLGDAADAQAVAHRRIITGAHELQTALIVLHAAARHAHTCYAAAVTANVRTWQQVRS